MENSNDFGRRLAALEEQVRGMQQELDVLRRRSQRRAAAAAESGPSLADRLRREVGSGAWVGRIGIGLLLIGLGLLFKFGIDRGWLTPEVRVVFGTVLAVFLVATGLRLVARRASLAHVLVGGGIATFFVTVFAAFQFYDLISYAVALAALAVSTAGCFVVAVRLRGKVLALVATLGGLGTPFLLSTGEGTATGLVVYVCLVLACAAGIYVRAGWRSLLWTGAAGGYLALQAGWQNLPQMPDLGLLDRASLQAGYVFCLFATGVLPVLRQAWHRSVPENWPVPPLRIKAVLIERADLGTTVLGACVVASVSRSLWDWPEWGWLAAGSLLVLGYAATYAMLRVLDLRLAATAHGVAAALVAVIVSSHLADAFWELYLATACVACALHLAARYLDGRAFAYLGATLALGVSIALLVRVVSLTGDFPPLLNRAAVVDLAVLALVGTSAWALRVSWMQRTYWVVVYAGILLWLYRDAVVLESGQAYASIAWGLCAVAFFLVGWQLKNDAVRFAGVVTLCCVVIKLLAVDLAQLSAVLRIMLFLGFGALLLLLSYLFPSLWRASAVKREDA